MSDPGGFCLGPGVRIVDCDGEVTVPCQAMELVASARLALVQPAVFSVLAVSKMFGMLYVFVIDSFQKPIKTVDLNGNVPLLLLFKGADP